ncbi:unnamed protein product [Adineta steineri]|uniref:G-protein coupled receptors family 1 profile domain-containing protein n=1 Tax=Adineta steineri TaxID=433720 RepID=A0A814XWQ6_9BILA|nr:unnamed protein product [Adineta steineri]CAF1066771.1 unnamed protein product [Adineta steineri]CAF1221751.1 unnamed protein product [Adineta steineri]
MLVEETFNFLTRLLNYIFAIPMLILGITGSILIVIVITQKRTFRQNTNLTYLLAGAIMTGIHLPTIYIQMILVYGFNVSLMNTNEAACREHTYLRYVTTVAAISFPCWAAFDQYVGTSRSAIIRNRWGSLRIVRLVIVCTVIFWFLFYIPIIFFTGITNGVCNFKPSLYTTLTTYIFTPLVYGLGPVGVITYCILGTVKNLRLNNIHRSHEKLAKQVRAMLIPQLIILAISGIPFGFQNIYLDMTSHIAKDAKRIAIENFLGQVVLIFYHFNYVFTFYIYVYKSSEFRKVLRKQVPRCIRACPIYPTDVIINNSIKPLEINQTNFTQTV